MIINLADIRDLKEAERKRVEALSFLSHDLRSPMVSLLSLVQLQRRAGSRLTEEEILDRVESDVGKVMGLCEDFIQLAQAESARRDAFDDVDITSVTHEAIDQVYAFARARDIHIERDLGACEAWAEGDVALLERAIGNLLSNAIKYSPANTTVTVTVSIEHGNVRCSVADQGYGIPAEELPKIFERYHRVQHKDGIRERGVGLGLAFVRVVAEKHRGHVDVSSVEGVGSTFVLTLPALDAGGADKTGRGEDPARAQTALRTSQGSLS
jgi:signal transduction histidine kinase